jgi:K+/H+ antiporter YhaU regulatory subunit KhtT
VRIGADSPLVGETVVQVEARARGAANIVAIERIKGAQRDLVEPRDDVPVCAGDVLLIDFPEPIDDARAQRLAELKLEPLALRGRYFTDQSRDLGMAEVLLPPDSELIDRTAIQSAFRRKYRLNVIGLRRKSKALEARVAAEKLRAGDVLLAIGRTVMSRAMNVNGTPMRTKSSNAPEDFGPDGLITISGP